MFGGSDVISDVTVGVGRHVHVGCDGVLLGLPACLFPTVHGTNTYGTYIVSVCNILISQIH